MGELEKKRLEEEVLEQKKKKPEKKGARGEGARTGGEEAFPGNGGQNMRLKQQGKARSQQAVREVAKPCGERALAYLLAFSSTDCVGDPSEWMRTALDGG